MKVLMFDGSTKHASDVHAGDVLMGDNSTPRRVLSVDQYKDEILKVIPSRDSTWTIGRSQMLSLQVSYVPHKLKSFIRGDVSDISVRRFLEFGQESRRVWKVYQRPVDFTEPDDLLIDPYIIGLWLGDGDRSRLILTQDDSYPHVIKAWRDYWTSIGFKVDRCVYGNRCPRYFVRGRTQEYTRYIRSTLVPNNQPATEGTTYKQTYGHLEKRIPRVYLMSSRRSRLALLAGLIDTDGCVDKKAYVVTTSVKSLASDVKWLARSLGLYSSVSEKTTQIKKINYKGTAYNVYISGSAEIIDEIPTREKHVQNGDVTRNPTIQEIKLQSLGEGVCYRFNTDGNQRYLMNNFIAATCKTR